MLYAIKKIPVSSKNGSRGTSPILISGGVQKRSLYRAKLLTRQLGGTHSANFLSTIKWVNLMKELCY